MLNFIVRIFGLCIKIFGILGMVVGLVDADLAGIIIFFLIFTTPLQTFFALIEEVMLLIICLVSLLSI